MITYKVLDAEEVEERGASPDLVAEAKELTRWDDNRGLYRLVQGVPVEMVGNDASEVEDMTFGRSLSWIAPALQASYDLGFQHGVAQRWAT